MARRVEMEFRGRVRRLFGNLGWKVLALVLAVACWFFIASGRRSYRELEVPLEFAGVPEGCTVGGSYPQKYLVRVSGKGRDLFRVRASDFKIVVNVAEKDPGVYRVDLSPADVIYSGHGDLKVEEILSDKIVMLELERRITKSVPVRADFRGAPRTGFYLGLPDIQPAKATLYGSATILDKVSAVAVTVDVTGRDSPFVADVAIKAPGGITLVGADAARVSVPVRRGVRRTFADVPVVAKGGTAASYKLSPPRVAITLEGEEGRLAGFGPPLASVAPRGPGPYPVKVDVPEHVTFVSVSPNEVEAEPAPAPK